MLQWPSRATIYGRRLVLLPEDCDLRLHRNLETEILERRKRFYEWLRSFIFGINDNWYYYFLVDIFNKSHKKVTAGPDKIAVTLL